MDVSFAPKTKRKTGCKSIFVERGAGFRRFRAGTITIFILNSALGETTKVPPHAKQMDR
jgi:hypothetical protein